VSRTAGEVAELLSKPGSRVKAGQALVQLRNRELELDLVHSSARAEEIEARILKATKEETADLSALRQTKAAIGERLAKLREDVANLTVVARHDGTWIAPGIQDYVGRWLTRGSNLGLVVNSDAFEFQATVLQEDADALFAKRPPGAEVRLRDSVGTVLNVAAWSVLPGEQRILPSAALGWRGGGDVPVDVNDERGNKAAEPYFKVIAALPQNAVVYDGSSGKIRFDLSSEPLLPRGFRRLWQLLQKRYQM
jgi:putative peptide zinc metalloprotease protein